MQLRKRPRQIHFPLDEPFGEEQPRYDWPVIDRVAFLQTRLESSF
jgi:hypothetical protein